MTEIATGVIPNDAAFAPIQYAPLGSLRVSPHNARKKPPTRIRELADDIRATGLLQNLVGHHIEDEPGEHGVCAGQRRLAALDLLKSEGHVTDSTLIPIRIVSIGEALAVSLIENAEREGMHIADQCGAFAQLVAEGRSVEEIAGRFSVAERDVRRALKLASVSPKLIDVYRDDGMTYDQVCALALSDSHEQQERIWFEAKQPWQQRANEIRRVITQEETHVSDNPLVAFVGLDAYEAAGGYVRRDLFSNAKNNGYINDLELLNRLAVEKLSAVAVDMGAEGWSWVETNVRRDSLQLSKYGRLRAESREFTRKEKTEFRKLEKARDEAQIALNAYYDEDEEEDDDAKREALEEAAQQADAAVDAYAERRNAWTDEQKARAGVFIWLDHAGGLQIERGLVKPSEKAAVKDAGVAGAERIIPEKAKPLHGETLCERLTAHRTAAVQAELMKEPTVALAYLMFAMVPRVFPEHYKAGATDALDAQFTPTHDRLLRAADDMTDSPAWQFIDGERQKWRAMLPTKVRDLLPWLLSRSEDVLANLFAFCVAATVNGLSRWDRPHDVNTLADTLGLDMTAYWKPTCASYLNHVPKQRIIDVVTQAVSAEAAAPLASMKKGDAAAAAELRLADSGWLPEVLTNRQTDRVWEDDEETDSDEDPENAMD
ncbi:ParB/RepB/Spo0J family partition protein [Burkholderia ubonensis]|uniref:ParB/RepB/Spo0J family partition protein n=1 Tax=Burkholderia ubonensis TaxID=101571 RepID=UPI00075F2EB0|nr:ParB/RepB/Spo0J family partition protein [Burkholderia ubonensis]KVL70311.1 chromosome partitioning protein ParB [Burkholderia ubonensis]KVL73174.1 chromosome partitioning protein ParB [Burkholderia ubonensis]KVL91002.1 chromosome partitioning protein ParB [Burkholderia ubonensis]